MCRQTEGPWRHARHPGQWLPQGLQLFVEVQGSGPNLQLVQLEQSTDPVNQDSCTVLVNAAQASFNAALILTALLPPEVGERLYGPLQCRIPAQHSCSLAAMHCTVKQQQS